MNLDSPPQAASPHEVAGTGALPSRIAAKNRRKYLIAGGLLFLALLAGVVIGAAGTIVYMKDKRFRKPSPDPEVVGKSVVQAMKETFELTPEEEEKLSVMLVDGMTRADTIRRQSWEAIGDEFDKLTEQVDEVLGPERRERWEEEKKRRYGERRRGRYRKKHHPREGGADHEGPGTAGDGPGSRGGPRQGRQ